MNLRLMMQWRNITRVATLFSNNVLRRNSSATHLLTNKIGKRLCSTNVIDKCDPVPLTSIRYKDQAKRGTYSTVNSSDISFFNKLLGDRVIVDKSDLEGYNVDLWKSHRGSSEVLLRPKTTDEVSRILQYCNERKLAVCPQAGNTGLCGGCIPVHDEIIISTSLMNQVISLDELSGVLVCQAGCVLERLNDFLNESEMQMPLDLGAKESCQIGGNVSTNAGGLRVLKFGTLHSTVLGLEAVLADGTVIDCMSTMKKDNTGYDLKHLFIGSEGTLGIVTKVAIQCAPKFKSTNLAFLALNDYSSVLQTYKRAKTDLGEILSACEYIDDASMDSVVENLNLKPPTGQFPFYMLIETMGSNENHDTVKLNEFLESSMADGVVIDGVVATQPSQIKSIWQIRERIAEAYLKDGYFYSMDFSVPVETFDQFVSDTRNHLGNDVKRVGGFGHLGDSNIHLSVSTETYKPEVTAKLDPFVNEWVGSRKGSISAEHGLGFKKKNHIHFSKSNINIFMMKQLKKMFDPNNILNPYKVLPDHH